ncbi:hypothetical protein GJ496_000856 [Pomphorhynchus laevis]|nr:hypothetical protein GJ496_000856 [Pomphorhynchus laevis]
MQSKYHTVKFEAIAYSEGSAPVLNGNDGSIAFRTARINKSIDGAGYYQHKDNRAVQGDLISSPRALKPTDVVSNAGYHKRR